MRLLPVLLSGLLFVARPAAAGADLVLRHVVIVDLHGRRTADAIVVRDGRITSVGALPEDAAGLPEIDLAGATVTPGLIDAHVHLSGVPGSGLREDTPAQTEELQRAHLRAYLSCGVTTVLDNAILPEDAQRIEGWIADGAPAPRIRWVGPTFSPPGGYVASIMPQYPEVHDAAEVRAQLDAFAPLNAIGVKMTFEEGFFRKAWPLYPRTVREAIVEATDADGLHRFVHAMSVKEYRAALAIHPYAMVHPVEAGARKVAKQLASEQIFVTSTLATNDTLRIEFDLGRMDQPPYAWTIPARERETATDPQAIRHMRDALVKMIVPGDPLLHGIVWTITYLPATQAGRLHHLERQVKILHDAGVPIVMGTDAGNWSMFPWVFHGPTSVHELELLVEAGLSPLDAIIAATATPARMLGLEQTLGEVAVGFEADLVVLDADPLTDITAYRTPRLVVQAGVAKTSAEWMAAP